MATPGQLVQVMADVLGISKATVVQYDRGLAENGLRSSGGRGTSAAKVTSRDAANLLIALAASPLSGSSAKDAAALCMRFASLTSVPVTEAQTTFSKLGLGTLAKLSPAHSFGSALSALVESAGNGELLDVPEHEVWVQFVGPKPSAHIVVGSNELGIEARLVYFDVRKLKRSRLPRGLLGGDLVYMSTVGFPTIRALGVLTAGGTA